MRYLVFTDDVKIRSAFEKSGYEPLAFHSPQELRSVCQNVKGAVIYLDCGGEQLENITCHLPYLNNRPDLRFAIIDSCGASVDTALYFHLGAVDYIGPKMLKEGLTLDRMEQVQRFKPIDSRYINNDLNESIPYSGSTWEGVNEGREYIFGMLYVGLDDMLRLRELLGQEGADKFVAEFRHWLNEHMDSWYGYQWLWSGAGGVYLFPFDGKNFYAMEAGMECFLNRRISRFSTYEVKTSFRIALHMGSSIFKKRGETGEIISDSINSLFHIANRDECRDELVISQEVRKYIPETLLPFLDDGEEFEGRKIYRLKSCL